MREPGQVDEISVAAELLADFPGNLGDLQRMGQPGPRHRVLVGRDHLGLAGQSPERTGVQHPGSVAGEWTAPTGAGRLREAGGLGRLEGAPRGVLLRVAGFGSRRDHHITVDPTPDDPPVNR